jgi:hypothetical protein
MGYYSEVAIAIDPTVIKKDLFLQNPLVPLEFKEEDYWEKGEALWCKHIAQTKWYESFKNVQQILAYLGSLKEGDYYLLVVGETEGDITHQGELQCEIWTETKIYIG